MALLVGAIARADERAGEDRAEAERLALLAEPRELVGVHPAVDRGVLRARLEVLADRHDVDAVGAQVAQRLDHLVVRLAEADDDAALRQHGVVGDLLRALQQPQCAVVARLAAAHLAVQAANGLDVVVEDVGPRGEDGARAPPPRRRGSRESAPRSIASGSLRLQRADRRGVVAGALVGDVVAVDRRDDDVLQAHLLRRLREAERLERVDRLARLAGVDVAVAAGAGAGLAEDLERRRPAAPALGDVRAARLFADRVQLRAVDQLLHVEVAAVLRRRAHLHPLRPARAVGDWERALHLRAI